ncbi:MAG: MgtC/SapB family protein [Clostridia bacterium]|nr:MgtC/SapB family protein [Clostridia bacterium]
METLEGILFSSPLRFETIAFRLLIATLLSGAIGFERGFRGRAAGLRTHILVCIGSALTVMVGIYATESLGYTGADPLRIAAQVVSGIGFLGAGTILVRGKTMVTGLTTAAGLWATAAIGIACGIGFYWGALIAALIAMFSFGLLTTFERSGKHGKYNIKIYIECTDAAKLNALMDTLVNEHKLCEIEITPPRTGIVNHIGIEATMILRKKSNKANRIAKIIALETVLCAIESV